MTLTAFETSDVEESGTADFESKRGLRVRRYKVKKKYSEWGTEISGEVRTVQDFSQLLDELFELAGIESKTK